jgi:PKD repeat protein
VVTDDDGGTDQTSQVVSVVDPPPPPNEDPTASFGFNPSAPETGETVSFDGSGSSDSDGTIASYSWSWGDGSPAGSGVSPTHSYGAAGDYTVTLVVTDDDGGTDQTSQVVSVSDPPPPPSNNAPTASFSVSCIDNDCTFTDLSTDTDGSVVAWSWDFGDGRTSTAQSPTNVYRHAGTYAVLLSIVDDDGAGDSASQAVTITCTTRGNGTRCR